jgi:hypothetical protein
MPEPPGSLHLGEIRKVVRVGGHHTSSVTVATDNSQRVSRRVEWCNTSSDGVTPRRPPKA